LNESETFSRVASVGGAFIGAEMLEVIVVWPFVEDVGEETGCPVDVCVFEHPVEDPTCLPNKWSAKHFFLTAWSLTDNGDAIERFPWIVGGY
jgi:hypothetical protein